MSRAFGVSDDLVAGFQASDDLGVGCVAQAERDGRPAASPRRSACAVVVAAKA